MKTKRFAPKDAKIIREHPDSSPEQLLEMGVSQKAYERLKALLEIKQGTTVLQPIKVEQVQSERSPAIVRLSNMRTGRVVRISHKAANMLSTKYPKEFKIMK